MLNDLLGWAVGLESLGLYFAGFLLPEVRRKNDAIWSGVGLIYALSILASGGRGTGGSFVGQLASAVLLGWFGWQVLQQRRQLASISAQTSIPDSVQGAFPFLKQGWSRMVSAYTDPNADDSDILVSGVKKVTSLVGGDSNPVVEPAPKLSERFKAEVAAADLNSDDAWADVPLEAPSMTAEVDAAQSPSRLLEQYEAETAAKPAESLSTEEKPAEPAVELPERFNTDTPEEPVTEGTGVQGVETAAKTVQVVEADETTRYQNQAQSGPEVTHSTAEPAPDPELSDDSADPVIVVEDTQPEDWPPHDSTV